MAQKDSLEEPMTRKMTKKKSTMAKASPTFKIKKFIFNEVSKVISLLTFVSTRK